MDKPKKPLVALVITLSFLMILLLSVAAVLLKRPSRPGIQRAIAPPPNAAVAKSAARIPSRRAATREALHCLDSLGETGASRNAVAKTRGLVTQLDAAPQPYAQGLSAVLKGILSHQQATSLPKFPGIPRDLLDRAAAACDARSHRNQGEIVLSFAGDCTFGTVNGDDSAVRFPMVYRRSGRTDYPFALVRPWFLNDDLTIVNFECTLTDATQTADKQWKFKGAARYALILPAGSVEAVGLSNNHSFDYLQAGFSDTVTNFRRARVPVFYQNVPFITTLQGIETVIIGDCTVVGENTTVIGGAPERVLHEIKHYKKPSNIVVVVMHWGSELDPVPRPWQQEMGRRFIDAGADAVVGHHPHVVQGIELYKGRYIVYSLGNFAFGGNSLARSPDTFVLRLRFHARGGKTSGAGASVVPCWITSSRVKNGAGVLRNNYQPKPVFGATADRTAALVLARSARLRYGVRRLDYFNLR